MNPELKALDCCAKSFDREHPLITDKHTEIFDCIPYVMVLFLRHTVQTGECKQTNGRMDGPMDANKRIISQLHG